MSGVPEKSAWWFKVKNPVPDPGTDFKRDFWKALSPLHTSGFDLAYETNIMGSPLYDSMRPADDQCYPKHRSFVGSILFFLFGNSKLYVPAQLINNEEKFTSLLL